MANSARRIAYCCLAILAALYVVGAVSHGVLRHVVQTLPLWFPIVLGWRGRGIAKWMALPCFVFWFAIMVFIWLFLLGWARIVSGTFSPVEIAMTIVVGVASLVGLVVGLKWRTKVSATAAVTTTLLFAILQVIAMRISLLPYIATH